ncbi:DNA-binding protein [Agromyces tropicus]|uniref:DNA-binding protein n=1 Tax=Agromyces tropicus TaxID=555371 RepID=A0ABN2UIW5_9MICO
MKHILLGEAEGLATHLLVMDKGDEAVAEIVRFAASRRIFGASVSAIGAASSVRLAYFDPESNEYLEQDFDEQLEICSALGDLTEDDGEPALHLHITLARRDYAVIGGHLMALEAFPTMEVVVTETPAHLRKRFDRGTGLALISVGRSDEG